MIQANVEGRRGQQVLRGQPGRALTDKDLAHHQRVAVAIKETMRLMKETDQAIEEQGVLSIE